HKTLKQRKSTACRPKDHPVPIAHSEKPMDYDLFKTRRTIELMERLATMEGYNLTPFDDVRFLRTKRPLTRTPVI
ncbi:hypothetical protein QN408_25615, partial [Pseudomonas sp. CCI4.2]|nr:hypothetical protein [Pseudomonas sp. CCI4.2]